jgi:hypothetical protein
MRLSGNLPPQLLSRPQPDIQHRLTATLAGIPEGKAGTLATLKLMRELVRQGKKTLPIRSLAVELVRGNAQKDWHGEIRSIQEFVRDRIRYVKDVVDVETLQTPDKTLLIGSGDCDDKSVLAASLLESVGHPTRFVAISFDDVEYVHVYPETLVGRAWLSVETTEPVSVGWQPQGVAARMIVHN